ncbi:MAG TPA: alpha/beta hydrolase [Thermoplasmata archaeon]|nr:alpha/beta hydrolase [Thermoplasmata archaeon]
MVELFERGGVQLAFEDYGGAGDPVTLVHGGWDDHGTWDRVVAGLSVALQVLTYDRREHGASSGPPRAHPVRDDASDLAALLEETGHFPTHVVGHSYGGAVALRLAVDRPELVRSVTVHEVPFVGLLRSGAAASERLQRARELALGPTPEAGARDYLALFASAEEQWATLDAASRRALGAAAPTWAKEMADPDALRPASEELEAIAVPVLATSGSRSPPFAAEIEEALVTALPNATAARLRDVGHYVQRTDPDLFVGVLGTFLLERNVPST